MKSKIENKGAAAQTFEDLHIYQRARELTNAVYALTRSGAFARDLGLCDQIRRASVSVMSNVAEGFERGTRAEFIQFLYIAKGSCGEVRAQLQIALDQAYITPESHAALRNLTRMLSGMISNFIAHLQRSNYPGEKFNRPQRQAQERVAKWMEAGRAAQLANIAAQRRIPSPPSNPSHLPHRPPPRPPSNSRSPSPHPRSEGRDEWPSPFSQLPPFPPVEFARSPVLNFSLHPPQPNPIIARLFSWTAPAQSSWRPRWPFRATAPLNAPSPHVRRRFGRTLRNLFNLYRPLVDTLHFFNNASEPPELVFKDEAGETTISDVALYQRLRDEFGS